ncbi:MAG: SiaC family regulatory phosphoprotein [Flavobacteriales bacterium]|nr:SiaC family regulatory phosphoprotein [Flavobacteriales bacterium]
MENLTIESTKSTPKVIGNAETGNLTLSGNLFPENSILFFKPIYTWISDLSKHSNVFNLEFELNYISSSSVIQILKTMQLIEELYSTDKTQFIWKYEIDDEDIQKLGEEFNKLTKSPMDLIAVDV